MKLDEGSICELAAQLMISPHAVSEAVRRGLVGFEKHRGFPCWRFGDMRNGCWRRLDGQGFEIRGQRVKAEAETKGQAWHRLIGLDDVLSNDRHEILLTPEGSKDALGAFHFADAEGTLSQIGVVAALGAGVKPLPDDIEKFRDRRVRILGDTDVAGQETVSRFAQNLLPVAGEVQVFNLTGLHCSDGSIVKDVFDLTRIDCDCFETNRDLWSVSDLDSKGERVHVLAKTNEFFLSSPPHVSPESHGLPVYPVSHVHPMSNGQGPEKDLLAEKDLKGLAARNACSAHGTARKRRWQLLRDLKAIELRHGALDTSELILTFDEWYRLSKPFLDSQKTRDDYLVAFLAEFGKVRVPTGEGETITEALACVSRLPLPRLPVMPEMADAPESWRRIAALHRDLSRRSANGIYFLTCRDAAKAFPGLSHQAAYNINLALAQLGVVEIVHRGDPRPNGGKAAQFRYLLSQTENVAHEGDEVEGVEI